MSRLLTGSQEGWTPSTPVWLGTATDHILVSWGQAWPTSQVLTLSRFEVCSLVLPGVLCPLPQSFLLAPLPSSPIFPCVLVFTLFHDRAPPMDPTSPGYLEFLGILYHLANVTGLELHSPAHNLTGNVL